MLLFWCAIELQYAVSIKKPLIIIRLHRTFVADGWLASAVGDLPIKDFVDDENFDAMMSSLVHEMSSVAGLKAPAARSSGWPIYFQI